MHKFDVFISYSVSDRKYAEEVATILKNNGVRVFFDVWDIRPGQLWSNTILSVFKDCRIFLVLIGKDALSKRGWVQTETRAAYERLTQDVSMMPVLLPGANPNNMPDYLKMYNYLDLREWKEALIHRMVAEITFRLGIQVKEEIPPKLFLCHAKEDDKRVEQLYLKLRDEGFDPWYDKEKLDVGDRWEEEIIVAIETSDFFTICLSALAAKKDGFIQKEIRTAIREFQRRSYEFAYMLPIRLEDCEVPNIRIDETSTLRSFQWIDLFDDDEVAYRKFVNGIWKQWKKRNA